MSRSRFAPLTLVLPAALLTACQAVAPAFGHDAAQAGTNADQLFTALNQRFTNVTRSPDWADDRVQLAKHALLPSRLFDDSTLWTSVHGDDRQLVVEGRFDGTRYVMAPHGNALQPTQLGQTRHDMRLRFLGKDQYEWQADVDMAVGKITGDDVANVFSALLSSTALPASELRRDYATSFPRSTAALGRLMTLDTLRTDRQSDGSSVVTLVSSLHPERLHATFPHYADYVEKYATPSSYHVILEDLHGEHWLEADASHKQLRFHLRTHNGHLVPLLGASRTMPDSLRLRLDVTTHLMLWDIGASNILADVRVIHTPHERGFFFRFHEQPDWHLPLAASRLLRTPLQRPFTGDGATVYFAVRAEPGASTQLHHSSSAVVQESAILRFLSRLSFSAMSDFAGQAEAEETQFDAELFAALRDDTRALLEMP